MAKNRLPSLRGEAERNAMAEKHHALVYVFARQNYRWRSNNGTLFNECEFWDIYQWAYVGLLRACELFDETRGVKFSVYAWRWMKASLRENIRTSAAGVLTPRRVIEVLLEVGNQKKSAGKGKLISEEDLEPYLPDRTVRRFALDLLKQTAPKSFTNGLPYGDRTAMFLDADFQRNEEWLTDNFAERRRRLVDDGDELESILARAKLTPRQLEAVKLYYGIDCERPLDFREMGKVCGYSYQRAESLTNAAMAKIRMAAGVSA